MKTKSQTLVRTLHPEVKVLDASAGLVEYVASNEAVDSYREVVRVSGWRFDLFAKNAPFVNSHNYSTIENLLGKVEDYRIEKGRKPALVETVRWAKDATPLANLGWRLTESGFLKAVSVGFWPVRYCSKWDQDATAYQAQLLELGLSGDRAPVRIYTEQQQVELSACILGANPEALAKAYKAERITDADLELLEKMREGVLGEPALPENDLPHEPNNENANSAASPADAELARQRAELGLVATVVRIANGM
jgi:hypothetical protein